MKSAELEERVVAADNLAGSLPRFLGETRTSVPDRLRRIRQAFRQLFGIPDYERYLAHASAHHPGAPLLSRRDFCAQAIERKYGKGGPRCC
jgi:uncharacterized short protein YbdD (DUF466 family)